MRSIVVGLKSTGARATRPRQAIGEVFALWGGCAILARNTKTLAAIEGSFPDQVGLSPSQGYGSMDAPPGQGWRFLTNGKVRENLIQSTLSSFFGLALMIVLLYFAFLAGRAFDLTRILESLVLYQLSVHTTIRL